jgi:hypothetical protein
LLLFAIALPGGKPAIQCIILMCCHFNHSRPEQGRKLPGGRK